MSVDSFIPELWSARLLKHLDNTHVFANLVNRDYEGEIKAYGDTVHIGKIGAVEVKPYAAKHQIKSSIEGPDELKMTDVTLKIDQADYFNFGIEDVDAAQVRSPLMDKAMQRVAYALADKTDRFLAGELEGSISTRNIGVSRAKGVKITAENAYAKLVELKVLMDKANVPSMGRFIVVPPQFEGFMLMDPKFAGPNSAKSEGALLNGFIGRAAGFDIYVSNNCPKESSHEKYSCIASIKDSTTYAQQVVKTEAYRPELKFADAIKGLNVYGAKVTNEEMVFAIYADFTSPEAP